MVRRGFMGLRAAVGLRTDGWVRAVQERALMLGASMHSP